MNPMIETLKVLVCLDQREFVYRRGISVPPTFTRAKQRMDYWNRRAMNDFGPKAVAKLVPQEQ